MLLRYRSLALTALLVLLVAMPARAIEPEAAQSFVSELAGRATAILSSNEPVAARQSGLQRVLENGFDLQYIGQLALGPTYRSLSDTQRSAYDRAFRQYVLSTYSRRIDEYGGERLEIRGATPAGSQDVKVESRVVGGATTQPVRIDWRVRERSAGPRVIDVEIEGVSLAISQRSEFSSVVQQQGVDGLIGLLQERGAAAS